MSYKNTTYTSVFTTVIDINVLILYLFVKGFADWYAQSFKFFIAEPLICRYSSGLLIPFTTNFILLNKGSEKLDDNINAETSIYLYKMVFVKSDCQQSIWERKADIWNGSQTSIGFKWRH